MMENCSYRIEIEYDIAKCSVFRTDVSLRLKN